ncbi:hypothetical protein HYC85_031950 [Camellia sinensis]|uniref:Phytosulfokine n=1 Tax=Camellia sinensis TaxID=4442 RepID=A0A7J7FSJ1_CAMSI|nr:hypothetical protein HYC85_031950 [Camellia sinensis]
MYLYQAYAASTTQAPNYIISLCLSEKLHTMKQNIHSIYVMFFIIFLVTTSQTVARFLATKQGEKETKLNEITTGGSLVEGEENDSLNLGNSLQQLMGVEECQNGDEDCLKRRMVAEAHLDYIYTQHHKP